MATSSKKVRNNQPENQLENQQDLPSNSLDNFRANSIAKQALNDADNDAQIYFQVYQNRLLDNMVSGFQQIETHRVKNYDLQANLGLQFCLEVPQLSCQTSQKFLPQNNG